MIEFKKSGFFLLLVKKYGQPAPGSLVFYDKNPLGTTYREMGIVDKCDDAFVYINMGIDDKSRERCIRGVGNFRIPGRPKKLVS